MLDLILLGTAIIIAGIVVVLFATISSSGTKSDETEKRTEVRGGGVIMIGPIPIIFGSDPKWAVIAILLAIVLVVLALVVMQVI